MKPLASWRDAVKAFVITYPAVLSGYIIYSYLFLSMIRFFLLAKAGEASLMRAFETFVAVPFLWLLALSLVKIIDVRTQWHVSETRRLQDLQELEINRLQLRTLQEVVRGVQDKVNNPLGVILLAADRIKESSASDPILVPLAEEIEASTRRVTAALAGFNALRKYEVRSAGSGVGNLAVPEPMPGAAEVEAEEIEGTDQELNRRSHGRGANPLDDGTRSGLARAVACAPPIGEAPRLRAIECIIGS